MTGGGSARRTPLADMLEAARRAGRLLMERQRRTVEVERKGLNDLVTAVDREAEDLIASFLEKRWPGVGFLAEESGTRGTTTGAGGERWIIDPLDGTTNYVHSYPCFGVSIGFQSGAEIGAGVIYDPNRDEMFSAEKGEGARMNGEPVRVSGVEALTESLLVTGFPFRRIDELDEYLKGFARLVKQAQGVRRDGSAALDLCAVACGRLDGFWERGLSPWDVAAGGLIVQEAGGRVSDYRDGNDWLEGGELIAATPAIHGAILESLTGP